ncbi:MAG: hypothetical protein JEZ11_03630 [Desulfobacterales bacterium]|nr:hypothetical protein [Desulfobacterales bacterium]
MLAQIDEARLCRLKGRFNRDKQDEQDNEKGSPLAEQPLAGGPSERDGPWMRHALIGIEIGIEFRMTVRDDEARFRRLKGRSNRDEPDRQDDESGCLKHSSNAF